MMRRVAFGKGLAAGALGAVAWEAAARVLLAAGAPIFDLVRTLGTLVVGDAAASAWWPVGMLLHAAVGAIWAIFYAYFFWCVFDWPPTVQGLVFALLPATLAGLVMLPEMALMHPLILAGSLPAPGTFAVGLGWPGPATVLGGHLVYGAVLGTLYTRPVGYRTARGRRRTPAVTPALSGEGPP